MSRQPWLHDSHIAVHGNLTSVADRDGEIAAEGDGLGVFIDDRRVVSRWVLRLDGEPVTVLTGRSTGSTTSVAGSVRHLGDDGPDPTVEVLRTRRLSPGRMTEEITIQSRASSVVRTRVVLGAAGDGADLAVVKGGVAAVVPLAASVLEAGALEWSDSRHRTVVRSADAVASVEPVPTLTWEVELAPGAGRTLEVTAEFERVAATRFDADPGCGLVDWSVTVKADNPAVEKWVNQSLADLQGLLLTDPLSPGDVFAGAGTPWYLTLFGRDSLWAARMMLPFGTQLAEGTLRALACRQGVRDEPMTGEEPGKILHEIRRTSYDDPASDLALPPVYYGTVDATPLWLMVLHDAWRWGLSDSVVRELVPTADAALGWLQRAVEQSEDGLVRYQDTTGHGLTNQGWKDSGDAMRFRTGEIAEAPIALLETQAYAVAAALGMADLFETALGREGDSLRAWAHALSERVRERFWTSDARGDYLAMALDCAGRQVDGVGSNMSHAIGTGLLTPDEEALVAARLGDPTLLGDYGLRTLSTDNPAYNPIGYHIGSIWSHDSAIAASALALGGFAEVAGRVIRGLLDASVAFDYRLPELYGGEATPAGPIPYPASCRPQAWAAAAGPGVLAATLGLRPDLPNRRLVVRPTSPAPFGALSVTGIRMGPFGTLSLAVGAAGDITDLHAPSDIQVDTAGGGAH